MNKKFRIIESIYNLIQLKIKLSENEDARLQSFIILIASKKPVSLMLKALKAYLESIKTTSENEIAELMPEIESILTRQIGQIKRVILKSDFIKDPVLKYYFENKITFMCTKTVVIEDMIFVKNQFVEIEKIESQNKYIAYPQFVFIPEPVFKNCFEKFDF